MHAAAERGVKHSLIMLRVCESWVGFLSLSKCHITVAQGTRIFFKNEPDIIGLILVTVHGNICLKKQKNMYVRALGGRRAHTVAASVIPRLGAYRQVLSSFYSYLFHVNLQ